MKFLLSLIVIILFLIFIELIDAWSFLSYLVGGLLLSIIPLYFAQLTFGWDIGNKNIFGAILTFLLILGIECGILYFMRYFLI